MLFLYFVLQWNVARSAINEPRVYVVSPGIFLTDIRIQGEKGANKLLFDTGSPHSWVFHYKLLRDSPPFQKGGFGTTNLKTRIDAPVDCDRIKYVDDSEYFVSTWTQRSFNFGQHSWLQPFGIVDRVKQRDQIPNMTGLLGAGRNSFFTRANPVFGFSPVTRDDLTFHLSRQDPEKACRDSRFVFFKLAESVLFHNHWAADTNIKYGETLFKTGIIFDTGSSLLVLNLPMFEKFKERLNSLNISVVYSNGVLSGTIQCADVIRLPTWEIHHDGQILLITPHMYTGRRAGRCRVLVAGIEGNHPMILGTPALRWLVSEFDAENKRMGLCVPIHSLLGDKDEFDPHFSEVMDCETCNNRLGPSLNSGILTIVAIILVALMA
jgi:hypothetical protein